MFIPIMPSIARELNASNSQAAYLSALFSLGTLLAVMVLGRISDSVGRRKILIFTITLSIAAQAATGFATQIGSYAVLAFIRFIAGVAAGNIWWLKLPSPTSPLLTNARVQWLSLALLSVRGLLLGQHWVRQSHFSFRKIHFFQLQWQR
jgi:MFS family permease